MSADDLDRLVRQYIYHATLKHGQPPTLAETAHTIKATDDEARESFQHLAAGRVLVLQPDTGEILMANPFSAVPTPFLVENESYTCYGNCIWDALGVAAMTKMDTRIKTACGDCGTAMEVRVVNGAVQGEGLMHFALPARRWWEDIVFN